MTTNPLDSQIRQLAIQRDPETKKWLFGRREILRQVQGATEWQVRKIIEERVKELIQRIS